MKKLISVLRATMAGDINIFRFYKNRQVSMFKKIMSTIGTILLSLLLLFTAFEYAYLIADPLHKVGATFVMLTLYMIIATVVVFMEGIYKSQGILFDAKDNDMLFSMPIKKSIIFTARLIKLLSFQYIFAIIVALPAFAVYAYFENPGLNFYLISLVMLILLPIIPTILACIFGYIVKALSSLFKKKNAIQLLLSVIFTAGLMTLSFKTQDFLTHIAEKASSINDFITRLYYPVGLYIELIQKFDTTKLLILVGINLIFAIIYVYLFSMLYFKIISKLSETSAKSNYSLKNKEYKSNKQITALFKKEFKRYLSSPIYIFNTIFGVFMILAFTIGIGINFEGTINFVAKTENVQLPMDQVMVYFPKIYICLLLFSIPTIAITASSISLEGKSFEITKSLPVSTKKIFLAKILVSDLISIPVILLSTIFLITKMKFTLIDSIIALAICVILPNIIAFLGLIINLKFPLLNAKSDTVVVKQSLSSLVAIFGGLGIRINSNNTIFRFKNNHEYRLVCNYDNWNLYITNDCIMGNTYDIWSKKI